MIPLRLLVLPIAAALALSGCVTRGYKLADKNTPAAVSLNFTSDAAPAQSLSSTAGSSLAEVPAPALATLKHLIVYHGPGSWKREAYWDEYVVSIENRGDTPLLLAYARLHDGNGDPLTPGEDPWDLEKLSKSWWESNALRQTGTYLTLGAGTLVGAGVVYSVTAAGLFGGVVTSGMSGGYVAAGGAAGGSGAAVAVGAAAVVALPLIAGGTIYMNVHRKHQVEAEFDRRQLSLPVTLAPGQTVQGSLFFRITPSPRKLSFGYRTGREPLHLAIDLAPLAGLHIKADSAPVPAAGSPATSP